MTNLNPLQNLEIPTRKDSYWNNWISPVEMRRNPDKRNRTFRSFRLGRLICNRLFRFTRFPNGKTGESGSGVQLAKQGRSLQVLYEERVSIKYWSIKIKPSSQNYLCMKWFSSWLKTTTKHLCKEDTQYLKIELPQLNESIVWCRNKDTKIILHEALKGFYSGEKH